MRKGLRLELCGTAVCRQMSFRRRVKSSSTHYARFVSLAVFLVCFRFSVCGKLPHLWEGKDEVSPNTGKQLIPKYLEVSIKGYG